MWFWILLHFLIILLEFKIYFVLLSYFREENKKEHGEAAC
jgi:hypothetical protein